MAYELEARLGVWRKMAMWNRLQRLTMRS